MPATLFPIHHDIIDALKSHPSGLTLPQLEDVLGFERKDQRLAKAVKQLHSWGYIIRKKTSHDHWIVWILM